MPAATWAVLGYALLIIVIGILGSRKTRTFTDFLLGGREVGPWMTAFSYGTAYFSAVLFIGFAGNIGWRHGLSGLWIAIGNSIVGVLFVWWLLGSRIKKVTGAYGVHTMPELLEARYGSRGIRLFTSLAIFVFFIPYSAAVFMGLGYLFESNFNMDYRLMVLLMGVFTGIYLVLGGYKSMAMIDVIFGIVMIFGVGVLLWSCLDKGGGLAKILADLEAMDPKLTAPVGPPGVWPLVSLVFLTSIAPLAMPQLVQKFYSIKDRRSVRIGMFASTVFAVIVTVTAYFTGALTRLFLTPESHPALFERKGSEFFDALMPEMLTTVIPPALSVVIFLLILSASMSTLAALVLISSSTIVKDLYAGFIHRDASDRRLTVLVRIASIGFIALSMGLALAKPAVIVTILSISWGAIGAVFLGPFLWAMFGKSVGKVGAMGAAVLGLGTCLVMFAIGGKSMVPQAGSVGMIVSFVAAPLISLVLREKPAATPPTAPSP
ncbi:MAG: sodium:solute symporter [Planctomycetota bacterium]